jgi:hypothetical protein
MIRLLVGLPASLLRGAIRAYQLFLSPVLPVSCRFAPSCSAYAFEAIGRFGVVRGGWLAARRFARCHPWSDCGHDPVPERWTGAPSGNARLNAARQSRG